MHTLFDPKWPLHTDKLLCTCRPVSPLLSLSPNCYHWRNLILSTVETSQVVKKQELHLGRPGTIRLDVSAYPPLTYDWSKDRQKLEFPIAGKTLDPYTGSISIDNVQESDEGNYTCTVVFGTGDTVEIEVTTIGKFFHGLFTENNLMLSILTMIWPQDFYLVYLWGDAPFIDEATGWINY